jgi:hypothetical protein
MTPERRMPLPLQALHLYVLDAAVPFFMTNAR